MKFPEWLELDQLNDPTYEHAGIDDALRHGETIADIAEEMADDAGRVPVGTTAEVGRYLKFRPADKRPK
jgi:hypothetical protein